MKKDVQQIIQTESVLFMNKNFFIISGPESWPCFSDRQIRWFSRVSSLFPFVFLGVEIFYRSKSHACRIRHESWMEFTFKVIQGRVLISLPPPRGWNRERMKYTAYFSWLIIRLIYYSPPEFIKQKPHSYDSIFRFFTCGFTFQVHCSNSVFIFIYLFFTDNLFIFHSYLTSYHLLLSPFFDKSYCYYNIKKLSWWNIFRIIQACSGKAKHVQKILVK